jgi:hypothetical protein
MSGFTAIDVRVGDLKHKVGNLLWYKSNHCNNHVLGSQSAVFHNKGSSEPSLNEILMSKIFVAPSVLKGPLDYEFISVLHDISV